MVYLLLLSVCIAVILKAVKIKFNSSMEDSTRFHSLEDVKDYLDRVPDGVDFRFGIAYRDVDGSIRCEMNFIDDENIVEVYKERSKGFRRTTDGIALITLSVLLFFVVYGFKGQHVIFDYMFWIAIFTLILGIYGLASGYRHTKKSVYME